MSAVHLYAACLLCVAACSPGDVTPTCPLPLAGWYQPKTGRYTVGDPSASEIKLIGNRIYWNDRRISEADLKEFASVVSKMNPTLPIIFDPTKSGSCAEAARIRDMIDVRAECSENRCWQGTVAEFEAADYREGEHYVPW